MKKIVGYILEYIWMFLLLGFLWPKGEIKNREEDLARLYKAKNQIEINDRNKIKSNNKPNKGEYYELYR